MITSCEIQIQNKVGLHARPAVVFVKKAAGFKSKITVENLTKKSQSVNAKSPLSVLSIAVEKGNIIRVIADGEDAEEAIKGILELVNTNFGEILGE
jgi:phosphocarrier protein HPr